MPQTHAQTDVFHGRWSLNQAAAEAHALSTGVPLLVPSSSKPLKREPPSKYDGYTTAADLGYSDPNAHLVAEQALRQLEGRIGKWEAVCLPPPPPDAGGGSLWTPNSVFGLASRKREEVESEEDGRNFKFIRREKRPVGWEEEGELAEIKVKVKEKVEGLMAKRVTKEDGEGAGGELAWKPVAWGSKVGDSDAGMGVKAIGEESVATHEDEELAKPKIEQEDSVVRPGSPMFKKRRGPPKGIGKVFKP